MLLESLDSVDWANIRHSHGTAEQFPVWIRQLVSEDAEVRDSARKSLFGFSYHQQSICEVSATIVPFFLELLAHKDTPEKEYLLYHLSSLAYGSHRMAVENEYGGNELVTYRNIKLGLFLYLTLLQGADPKVRLAAFRTIVSVRDRILIKNIPSEHTVLKALIAAIKSEMNPAIKSEMIGVFIAYSGVLCSRKASLEYEDLKNLLLVLAREDPYPKVKLNAMKFYLDLLRERPDEAHFVDSLLRDVLINPEKYDRDDSLSVKLTLDAAIDYLVYLPRMARLAILSDALSKSRYPSDAHLILQALLDTIFLGFVRRENSAEIKMMRLERRKLRADDPAERPDNSHISFRSNDFMNEQETRNVGWFYLSDQPPMGSLSNYERKLLEQALNTEMAWMLHSNLLAIYGLPVTRAETLKVLNSTETTM